MIHELRTYTIRPGQIAGFIELTGTVGRSIRGDRYGKLLGYWKTLQGSPERVVHLWEYPDPNERARLRGDMMRDPGWIGDYVPKSLPNVLEQTNMLLTLAPGHSVREIMGNAIYELRTHSLKPGSVVEWMDLRRSVVEGDGLAGTLVAAWTTESGPLNSVVELWGYPDANAWLRSDSEKEPTGEREPAMRRLNELTRRMEATLLAPSNFSPLQ